MSVTKDGFYNIEGKMFEVVHGVEGDCLTLGDEDGGTRISGPKPWGGGQVTKTFVTQEKYGPIERLEEENAKLRELIACIPKCWEDDCDTCPMGSMVAVLDVATECMAEELLREFGIEV